MLFPFRREAFCKNKGRNEAEKNVLTYVLNRKQKRKKCADFCFSCNKSKHHFFMLAFEKKTAFLMPSMHLKGFERMHLIRLQFLLHLEKEAFVYLVYFGIR